METLFGFRFVGRGAHSSANMSLPLHLLLLLCVALPLHGVEKVRNRGYQKDPDAGKVRESSS